MSDVVGRAIVELSATLDARQLQQVMASVSAQAAEAGKKIEQSFEGATAGSDKLASSLKDKLGSAIKTVSSEIGGKLGGAVKAVTKSVTGLASIAAVGLAAMSVKAIKAGIDFNALQANVLGSLKSVLGFAKANELLNKGFTVTEKGITKTIKSVNELADNVKTVSRAGFLEATQNLIGFGVAAERVVPVMEAISKAVDGVGGGEQEFASFTSTFAKIQAAGRVTGDALFELSLKGIDGAKLLADQLNKSEEALKELGFAGRVTGADIKDAVSKGAIDATKGFDLLIDGLTERFGAAGAAGGKAMITSLASARGGIKSRLRDIGGDITAALVNPLGTVFDPKGIKAFTNLIEKAIDPVTGLAKATGNILIDQKTLNSFQKLSEGGGAFVAILAKVGEGLKRIREIVAQSAGLQVFIIKASVAVNNLVDRVLALITVVDKLGKEKANPALVNGFNNLLKVVAALTPVLTFLGTNVFNKFAKQIPFIGKLLSTLNPVVAALLVIAIRSKAVQKAISDVTKSLQGAIKGSTLVGASFKNLANAFNAINDAVGLALAAVIRAVGAALVALIPVAVGVANALTRIVIAVTPFIPILVNGLIAGFTALVGVASRVAPIIQSALVTAFNALVRAGKAIVPILDGIINAVTRLAPIVGRGLVTGFNALVSVGKVLAGVVGDGLVLAFNLLAPVVEKTIGFISNLVTAISNADFSAIASTISGGIGTALEGLGTSGEEATNGLLNLGTSLQTTGQAFKGLLTAVATFDIQGIITGVQDLFGAFNDLKDQLGPLSPILDGIAIAAAAAAAAFAAYKIAIVASAAASAIGTAAMVLTTLATEGLTAALAALEVATGVAISPFILIAAIVAAVAVAFVALYLKVQPVRDAVDSLVDGFLNLIPSMDTFKQILEVVVAAAIIAGTVFLALNASLIATSVAVLALEAAAAIAASPFIAIGVAVAALAALLVVLYIKVQPVRDAIDGLIDSFLSFLPTMETVKNVIGVLADVITVLAGIIITVLVVAFNLLKPIVIALANLIKGVFVTAFQALVPLVKAVGDLFKAVLVPVFQLFGAIASFVGNNIKTILVVAFIALLPVIIPVAAAIGALIVVLKLLPTIIGVISAIINGVLKVAIGVITFIIQKWVFEINLAVKAIKFLINIIGEVVGFIVGLVAKFINLKDVVAGVVDAFLNFGPIKAIIDTVVGAVGGLIEKFTSFGPIKAIVDGIGGAFDKVAGIVTGLIDKMGKVKGLLNKLSFGKLFKEGKDGADETGKSVDEIGKKGKGLGGIFNKIGGLFKKPKKDAEDAAKAVKGLGDSTKLLSTTPTDKLTDSLKRTKDAAEAAAAAAQKNLETTLGQASSFDSVISAAEKVKTANEGVKDAQASAAEATKKISDLQKERAKVLRDTISPTKEIAQAERDLTRARFGLAATDREIIATQKELTRLRGVETAEKEAANERSIERAKIAVNNARRDEQALLDAANKEKEKGNKEAVVEVSLAGLSLTQARNKLAAIRATLAAQQAGKKASEGDTKEAKTQQQIDDEKKSARLDVLDAEQSQRDAERSATQFKLDTAASIEENERKLVELGFQKTEQNEAINNQQIKLNELRAGETTLAKALKEVDEKIADAKREQAKAAKAVADAVKAARDAQRELNLAQAVFTGNLSTQAKLIADQLAERTKGLNLEKGIGDKIRETTQALRDQGVELAKLNGARDQATKDLEAGAVKQAEADKAINALKEEIARANAFEKDFGDFLKSSNVQSGAKESATQKLQSFVSNLKGFATTGGEKLNDAFVRQIAEQLVASPNNDLLSVLREILRKAGINIPGLAQGGIVEGSRGAFGTLIRAGEYGRREAVLPLQVPARMEALMKDSRILNPVLAALPRVSLPQPTGLAPIVIPPSSPSPSFKLGGGSDFKAASQRRREQRELAQMIAQEMVAAGGGGGGGITVQAPITVEGAYNEELLAKRIEDRIIKSIERRLK